MASDAKIVNELKLVRSELVRENKMAGILTFYLLLFTIYLGLNSSNFNPVALVIALIITAFIMFLISKFL